MRRTLLVGIAATALLVAGCSSNDSDTSASPTSTASKQPAASTSSAVAEATSSGKAPSGQALYDETCEDIAESFASLREFAESTGESWDAQKAADDFMATMKDQTGWTVQFGAESVTVTGGDPSQGIRVDDWDDLSKSDQEQIRKAVEAAAKGEC
ncbi:hypothetical protein [Rhodococcus sp. AG1013]|jgi:nitrous oxide reductase accessory protein NosL|uniref:hypothetical protein n=1 Tax=unclassified Rhodococcus (in: high G+C Gram-positive bacteria) TaxID=192944 RepID=UPI0011C03C32|nr:hypothetical protein [Rhodococcus sp. AG1013]